MHKILILGPQGSGKGTQAKKLATKLDIPALSAGDLLREEMASGSSIGKEIARFVNDGNLVPDHITSKLLKKRLLQKDMAGGFILDGFPRFMEQYDSAKTFLTPSAVIVITVPKEESIQRILKRADIENRTDDTPESIKKRLSWTKEKTAPVIEEYRKHNLIHEVSGIGDIGVVASRIHKALNIT
tara:strand:+ start:490 stop:1044 length:555 start_codon:yes stop_codon:yes gene_type:complete